MGSSFSHHPEPDVAGAHPAFSLHPEDGILGAGAAGVRADSSAAADGAACAVGHGGGPFTPVSEHADLLMTELPKRGRPKGAHWSAINQLRRIDLATLPRAQAMAELESHVAADWYADSRLRKMASEKVEQRARSFLRLWLKNGQGVNDGVTAIISAIERVCGQSSRGCSPDRMECLRSVLHSFAATLLAKRSRAESVRGVAVQRPDVRKRHALMARRLAYEALELARNAESAASAILEVALADADGNPVSSMGGVSHD